MEPDDVPDRSGAGGERPIGRMGKMRKMGRMKMRSRWNMKSMLSAYRSLLSSPLTPSSLSALLVLLLGVAPASAQVNLSGDWSPRQHEDQPDRGPGPELGDYTGMPITDGARLYGDSWDASRLTIPEHQCKVHNSPYIYRGPLQVRIWEEKDLRTQQVVALKHYISTYEQSRTIWMDGRPHPPEFAPHTWMGFSTGVWHGDILTVTATHINSEWFRRNGIPNSDRTKLIEHYIRHGDVMTHVTISTDPVNLTEPYIKSQEFILNPRPQGNWLWPCEVVEEVDRPKDEVPHYLPGQNAFVLEFAAKHGIPVEATRGGAETMYPEYMKKLRALAASDRAAK
jgi:hypothetical protein